MRGFWMCVMLLSACYWFAAAVGAVDLSTLQVRIAALFLGIFIVAQAIRGADIRNDGA